MNVRSRDWGPSHATHPVRAGLAISCLSVSHFRTRRPRNFVTEPESNGYIPLTQDVVQITESDHGSEKENTIMFG